MSVIDKINSSTLSNDDKTLLIIDVNKLIEQGKNEEDALELVLQERINDLHKELSNIYTQL
jgi:hypothetical protein